MLFQPKYMSKEMDKAMKAFDSELSQKDLIDIINSAPLSEVKDVCLCQFIRPCHCRAKTFHNLI